MGSATPPGRSAGLPPPHRSAAPINCFPSCRAADFAGISPSRVSRSQRVLLQSISGRNSGFLCTRTSLFFMANGPQVKTLECPDLNSVGCPSSQCSSIPKGVSSSLHRPLLALLPQWAALYSGVACQLLIPGCSSTVTQKSPLPCGRILCLLQSSCLT